MIYFGIVIQHRLFRHLQCTADDDFQCVYSHSTQSKIKGISVFRTALFTGSLIRSSSHILWMQLLSPSAGLINTFLGWFHIPGPAWLLITMDETCVDFDENMEFWRSNATLLSYITKCS